MNQSSPKTIGISGLAAYVPPFRVWLEDWCDWTDNQWPKIREVVGRSFRVRGPNHSVYTMAANAVIRLIDQYDVDPARVKPRSLDEPRPGGIGTHLIRTVMDQAEFVRTAGEQRLSNFLLWQLSYGEFHVADVAWPEFRESELEAALDDFASRTRSFGGLLRS